MFISNMTSERTVFVTCEITIVTRKGFLSCVSKYMPFDIIDSFHSLWTKWTFVFTKFIFYRSNLQENQNFFYPVIEKVLLFCKCSIHNSRSLFIVKFHVFSIHIMNFQIYGMFACKFTKFTKPCSMCVCTNMSRHIIAVNFYEFF